jgi:uncharacterized integral membrane protein (TIGR02327 family)
MFSIGQLAVTSMVSHLIFIYLTWRVLQTINFDPLIRKGRAAEAKILLVFITIAVGTAVSNFFLDILHWSQDLVYLF